VQNNKIAYINLIVASYYT